MPHLVLIYGPPLAGKSSLAREVASRLEGKTALVSIDALLRDGILVPDPDTRAELEMVHTQARLMVANYLKNRYHVVLEGAYYYERDGELHRHEQEIDQTLALMRNLARAPLTVRLAVTEAALRRRAEAAGRQAEADTALRIDAAYRTRYGLSALELSVTEETAAALAQKVIERLQPVKIA